MKLTALTTYLPVVIAIASFVPAQQAKAIETGPTPAVTAQTQSAKPTPTNTLDDNPTNDFQCEYERCMNIGYAATEARNYEKALSYFTLALLQRPGDRYATLAYANVTNYLDAKDAASDYKSFMRLGYGATQQKHYQTALYYFRRALQERPADDYARQAIRNVQNYINGAQFMSKVRQSGDRVLVEQMR